MDEAPPEEVAALWQDAMLRGDWAEAWRQTDRIELPRRARQRSGAFAREPRHLVWNGTPLAGRTVLVRCEHGLGDTLQFIRYVPLVRQLARRVTVLSQPHLLPLLAGAPQLGEVLDGWSGKPAPPHEVDVEVMELAYVFRSSIETVPSPCPQLADRAAVRLPVALPDDGRLKVGLLWAASDWDTSRSVPLEALEPLLRVERAAFFSLQQGDPRGVALAGRMGVEPLSHHTAPIESAAAAMLAMDLVITVDAMAAHLAGTLGRPTWLLLKHRADWRWMQGRSDSPWYPGVRLWRQPRPGHWQPVVAAVSRALRELAHGP